MLPHPGLPPTSKKCKKYAAINDSTGKTEQNKTTHFSNFLILHSSKFKRKVQKIYLKKEYSLNERKQEPFKKQLRPTMLDYVGNILKNRSWRL